MAADLLTTIRSELDARLGELRPLLSEYERLVAAVDALETHARSGAADAPAQQPESEPTALSAPVGVTPVPRRRGRPRGSAAGTLKRAAAPSPVGEATTETKVGADSRRGTGEVSPRTARGRTAGAKVASTRERAPKGAARQAIVAALEHGSHTVGELAVVTAMTGPNINGNIRRLLQEGAITKTSREGKTAYALVQRAA
jgi:hypothetical protein